MRTIAYLANQFPCPVEPYVGEEIEELRSRRIQVVTGSDGNRRREQRLRTLYCSRCPEWCRRGRRGCAFSGGTKSYL